MFGGFTFGWGYFGGSQSLTTTDVSGSSTLTGTTATSAASGTASEVTTQASGGIWKNLAHILQWIEVPQPAKAIPRAVSVNGRSRVTGRPATSTAYGEVEGAVRGTATAIASRPRVTATGSTVLYIRGHAPTMPKPAASHGEGWATGGHQERHMLFALLDG